MLRAVSMSERGEAKRINARLQKNSGRGKIQKGDAVWHDYVLDFKEYDKSFSITQNVWGKITTDTLKTDRTKSPVISLILGGKTRLAIIEWAEFERLVEIDNQSRAGTDQ